MTIELDFDTWKAIYQPRIYVDTGAWCEEHAEDNEAEPSNWCECEFLYTFELSELEQDEDDSSAISERRVWTWNSDGTISSGIANDRADILVTVKPYEQEMIIK